MPTDHADPPLAPEATLAGGQWEIQLLGQCSARHGDRVLTHFPSRPIAALLARLALFPRRTHAREELAELLWPGAAPGLGRNRLRHALSTLRALLDVPGLPAASVLQADRQSIRLNPQAIGCDALHFETLCRQGRSDEARDVYVGDLMPGYYDEWILDERTRLADLFARLEDMPRADPSPPEAAAPNSLRNVRLPAYLNGFFGRDAERLALAEAVVAHRLVTVTGTGGCGKTRLAIEMAGRLGGFDRIAFVALAECRAIERVIDQVRAALELPGGAPNPLDQVVDHLSGHHALLVLDNFEQLTGQLAGPPGEDPLSALLRRVPGLRLLVTSRRALRRVDEHEWALAPLPLPDREDDLAAAACNPGLALFVDRARAVRADFHVHPRNLSSLIEVCLALEGLPLAIEIAASRVRAFSPSEMVDALARGIAVVARTGPAAARLGRHASLVAAISWSWGLLSEPHRHLLASLTVFRGGWNIAGAAAVAPAAAGTPDPPELLEDLVADSLVQVAEDAGGRSRFRMLESVREFVADQLPAAEAGTLRRRHRAYCLAMAETDAARHAGVDDADLPNIVEALSSASRDGDIDTAIALTLALKEHWLSNGASPEALAALGRVAGMTPAGTAGHCEMMTMLATLLVRAGAPEQALRCAASALQCAGSDTALEAEAVLTEAQVRWDWHRDGDDVLEPARRALRLADAAALPALQARAALLLGAITLWHLKQTDVAARLFDSADRQFAERGDQRARLGVAPWHVACLQAACRHADAIRLATEAARQAWEGQYVETYLLLLNRLSRSFYRTHQHDKAVEVCQRQARLARRHGMVRLVAYALWNQPGPLAHLHRPEPAAMLMAFSQQYWIEHFGPLSRGDLRQSEALRRIVARQIGAERMSRAWAEGLALSPREGLALGCGWRFND